MAVTAEILTTKGTDDYRTHALRVIQGVRGRSVSDMVAAVNRGFSIGNVERLVKRYEIPESYLIAVMHISPSTFRRRKLAGRLNADESDRLVRIAGLYGMAEDILGNAQSAAGWMREPNRGLGGKTPTAYAVTEVGAREVEDLLGRLAHGITA